VRADAWLIWGFAGTLVLTSMMAASQSLGLTRVSLPYLLGTMLTPSRDRAKVLGFLFHLLNGWIFSLFYLAVFHALGRATWWFGAAIGLVHAGFVLTVGMRLLPGVHPRMAGERQGPTVGRQLEPPGFLGLNYGLQTPATIVIAHAVFGAILGAFYPLGG
jgi:hypothetical protein